MKRNTTGRVPYKKPYYVRRMGFFELPPYKKMWYCTANVARTRVIRVFAQGSSAQANEAERRREFEGSPLNDNRSSAQTDKSNVF